MLIRSKIIILQTKKVFILYSQNWDTSVSSSSPTPWKYIIMLLAAPSIFNTSTMENNRWPEALPPYEPSPEYTSLTDEKSKDQFLLEPELSEPGFAISSTLTRGLQVPSRTSATTSGFAYPDELSRYDISPESWSEFTAAICEEAKLSRQQWTTVIGKGLGTLALGGVMIGFLGAIPAIFVAKNARKRQEQRNLIASMAGARGERLSRHIAHWNDTFFRPRGVLIRVDLPDEYLDDMDIMDLHRDESGKSETRVREKAALKARVVIIPLDGSSASGRSITEAGGSQSR